MSLTTHIQWCDATVNFWWGCTKVSKGCQYCYAEQLARAFSGTKLAEGFGPPRATWGPGGKRWLRVGEAAGELLRLEKRAVKKGRRLRVFINSMSDTFEDRRDLDGARKVLFAIAPCVPHLDLLLLTKRPENVEQLMSGDWILEEWPKNVWLGFSAEDQEAFDGRWPIVENLARRFNIPCTFCSAEPLLGPLNIEFAQFVSGGVGGEDEPDTRPLDWLIVGGESGRHARPLDLDWIRNLITQGREFDIPIFVKQLGRIPVNSWLDSSGAVGLPKTVIEKLKLKDSHGGDIAEWPESFRVRELPVSSMLNGVKP